MAQIFLWPGPVTWVLPSLHTSAPRLTHIEGNFVLCKLRPALHTLYSLLLRHGSQLFPCPDAPAQVDIDTPRLLPSQPGNALQVVRIGDRVLSEKADDMVPVKPAGVDDLGDDLKVVASSATVDRGWPTLISATPPVGYLLCSKTTAAM